MGPVGKWHEIRMPLDLDVSDYDSQIRMDVARTHSSDRWFDPHREPICKLLNAFANTNIGFGYPQGLNFLVFPLWKVYFLADAEWVMHDVFYSLQYLVGALLSVYPIHKSDKAALTQMEVISSIVKLRVAKKYPELRQKIFSQEYALFVMSLVSKMVPTMFANIYTVDNTILLWDNVFKKDSILDSVVQCVVSLICINHNAVQHLSLSTCMTVIQESAPYTMSRVYGEIYLR
jgi:hypothetical protein